MSSSRLSHRVWTGMLAEGGLTCTSVLLDTEAGETMAYWIDAYVARRVIRSISFPCSSALSEKV